MNEETSFRGRPRRGGRGQRLLTGLVALLAIGLIAVAFAQPWGPPIAERSASPGATPRASDGSLVPAPTTSPGGETPASPRTTSAGFTLPGPPPPTATWMGLRWTRVARDPLSLVESVLRWRDGFVAVGRNLTGTTTTTPVWTSVDGRDWQLLPFNTPTTFWPGIVIVGVVEVPAGLVAVTGLGVNDCQPSQCSRWYAPPFVAWTSSDGTSWSPNAFPDLGPGAAGGRVQLAEGPAGLLAVSAGPGARAAISTDGVAWTALPDDTLRGDFVIEDLLGTPFGYVAGGRLATGSADGVAATLWSADGRTWSVPEVLPPGPETGSGAAGGPAASTVVSLVGGRDGIIAVGDRVSVPGDVRWWQSSDGRHWAALERYPPLGPASCADPGCERQPAGLLVGDGRRMVAIGGGAGAGSWVSWDGLRWQSLSAEGIQPSGLEAHATILPGGVLLSSGQHTWLGEAIAGSAGETTSPGGQDLPGLSLTPGRWTAAPRPPRCPRSETSSGATASARMSSATRRRSVLAAAPGRATTNGIPSALHPDTSCQSEATVWSGSRPSARVTWDTGTAPTVSNRFTRYRTFDAG